MEISPKELHSIVVSTLSSILHLLLNLTNLKLENFLEHDRGTGRQHCNFTSAKTKLGVALRYSNHDTHVCMHTVARENILRPLRKNIQTM